MKPTGMVIVQSLPQTKKKLGMKCNYSEFKSFKKQK